MSDPVTTATRPSPAEANAQAHADGKVVITLSGNWYLGDKRVDFAPVEAVIKEAAVLRQKAVRQATATDSSVQQAAATAGRESQAATTGTGEPQEVDFDASGLRGWDSSLMSFLQKVCAAARLQGMKINYQSLPEGPAKLLVLANCVPEVNTSSSRGKSFHPLFTRVGTLTLWLWKEADGMMAFLGQCILALLRFMRGKARFRRSDFWLLVQQTGLEALPIVALIAFLIGMIMAFVGAVQLQKFGADIFVADLVGLAMVREMGVMMTGIILCGRTGAAYAAQIGSMKIGEEVDALETFGISPIDFLVLPRLLAVTLMTPILVLFANAIGIIGGMIVGVSLLDVTMAQFINRLIGSLDLTQISTGLIKSVFFGVLVAYTGCLRGMQCGSSSAEVGRVTTSAVVTGITALIIADAVFAVLFNIMGI